VKKQFTNFDVNTIKNKFKSPIINSGTYGIKERDSAIRRGTKTEKNSSRLK
jgi:hypothetical protein